MPFDAMTEASRCQIHPRAAGCHTNPRQSRNMSGTYTLSEADTSTKSRADLGAGHAPLGGPVHEGAHRHP